MNKYRILSFSFFPSLLLLVSLVWSAGCGKPAEEVRRQEGKRFSGRVYSVAEEKTTDYYLASGDVRARSVSVLTAKVPGYLRRIHVREGQKVTVGQLLAEIESAELASQDQKAKAGTLEAQQARQEMDHALQAAASAVKAAEAQNRLASDTYKRFQALLAKESVSRQEFDEVEARYLSAQAQLDQANQSLSALKSKQAQVDARIQQAQADVAGSQTFLSYLRVTAPFSGTVTRRHVDPGTLAAPGVPLFTLEEDARLQLEVTIPESLRWKILEDQPILADVETAEILRLAAPLLEKPASADASTRSFLLKLQLPESPKLRSGMFGRAHIPIGWRQVIVIPSSSLVRRGQLEGIFVLSQEGRVQWRLVKSGASIDRKTEILSGLKIGEKIVENPPADMTSGDSFEVRS